MLIYTCENKDKDSMYETRTIPGTTYMGRGGKVPPYYNRQHWMGVSVNLMCPGRFSPDERPAVRGEKGVGLNVGTKTETATCD